MQAFITANGGIIASVVLVCVSLNVLLSGMSAALEKIKDKTSTDLDNKLYNVVHGASNFLQKIVDVASANREHTDTPTDQK